MEENKDKKTEGSGKLQLKKTFNVGQIKEEFHNLGSTYYFSHTDNTFSLNVSGFEVL